MNEIVKFPGITTAPEPAGSVLEKAKDWNCEDILVIGLNAEGELIFGGNVADMERISWLLTLAEDQFMANLRAALEDQPNE